MTDQRSMIFHVPFALNPESVSASGIRPVQMRRAFEALGYDVHEISGVHSQRREQIKRLKERIRRGAQFEFLYSEAATTPTGLGEPVTLATSLHRDIAFLRYCRRAGIRVGLFYRDIYWQFEEYSKRVGQPYATILRSRYKADLRGYRSAVDRIYLPSAQMAAYLPSANQPQASALPPGCNEIDSTAPATGVSLLYVGGINDYYRMEETVRGVGAVPHARMTICTRESEWAQNRSRYTGLLRPSVKVVHESGTGLEPLYDDAHVGSLLMEPIEYREFAVPLKLYEYLAHGKPIIATEGTLAGEFVHSNGIGWTIPYRSDALVGLLNRLNENRRELEDFTMRARTIRHEHSWTARARTVATDLSQPPQPAVSYDEQ